MPQHYTSHFISVSSAQVWLNFETRLVNQRPQWILNTHLLTSYWMSIGWLLQAIIQHSQVNEGYGKHFGYPKCLQWCAQGQLALTFSPICACADFSCCSTWARRDIILLRRSLSDGTIKHQQLMVAFIHESPQNTKLRLQLLHWTIS